MSSLADAATSLLGAAARSVGAAGLEREIGLLRRKIKERKREFGSASYGPLDAGDDDAVRRCFVAAFADVEALQREVDRKVAALDALRGAGDAGRTSAAAAPPRNEDPAARDRRLAAELSAATDQLTRALHVAPPVAEDALRRANGDREAAANIILAQFEAAPPAPVEAEVLSWDDPIQATLVDAPDRGPERKKSLAKRLSARLKGSR